DVRIRRGHLATAGRCGSAVTWPPAGDLPPAPRTRIWRPAGHRRPGREPYRGIAVPREAVRDHHGVVVGHRVLRITGQDLPRRTRRYGRWLGGIRRHAVPT